MSLACLIFLRATNKFECKQVGGIVPSVENESSTLHWANNTSQFFINLQDGRMRPTAVDGIWVEWKPRNELNVNGVIYMACPRVPRRYFSIENSYRPLSFRGRHCWKPSAYKGNLQIPGIVYAGLMGKIGKSIRWQSWQMWVMQLYYLPFTSGRQH